MRTRDKTVSTGDPAHRTRRWRRTGAALAVGALAGALAACSDGSTPATSHPPVTATVTDTITPSPSTSPTPTLPAGAKQPTRQGAEEFFRYFYALYNYGFASLDSRPLREISAPSCGYCKKSADAMDSNKRQGLHIRGGEVTVKVAVAAPGNPSIGLIVNAVVDQEPVAIDDPSNASPTSAPGRSGRRVDAGVKWTGSTWKIIGVEVLKPGASN